jgi:hypothetical protein
MKYNTRLLVVYKVLEYKDNIVIVPIVCFKYYTYMAYYYTNEAVHPSKGYYNRRTK